MRKLLELEKKDRVAIWNQVTEAVETFADELPELRVCPSTDPKIARELLEAVDFDRPMLPSAAIELVVDGLRHHQVHNGHPRYFGLFNPATSTMSVAADTLVAAFNPQLAAWTHAPFACEVEQFMIREIGARVGYAEDRASGSFTSGGAEANHSALLTALVCAFPELAKNGVRALGGQPVLYVSPESHHSFVKAARLAGLGTKAVRLVPVDDDFVLDPAALADQIGRDRAGGELPFLVVATLGTTGAGLVDPMASVAAVGEHENLWVHADAAWGGAAALVPELKRHFEGIERADSITIDAHKWLSVPMGAGMFLTRHREMLERTFAIDAGYMPTADAGTPVDEPHRSSMQWTRRFIGLKLFLTFLVAGWKGYEDTIRNMVRLGDVLRDKLAAAGWRIVNRTPLPVVCFQDSTHPKGASLDYLASVAKDVEAGGHAWVSTVNLGGSTPAIRACITNFRNSEESIDELIETLDEARRRVG